MALFNSAEKRKPLFSFALIAVPFVFVVIALGAFTRLADAGLGCPDWPTCYGHVLWPTETHEIATANEVYDETPVEMDKTWPEQVHRLFASMLGLISLVVFFISMRFNPNKRLNKQLLAIVAVLLVSLVAKIVAKQNIEVTAAVMHDTTDIVIGSIVVLCIFALAWLSKLHGAAEQPIKLPAFIVAFVILQGLFGMWTVTLKVWPQVVTTHLLGGFTMAALFWLLALRLNNQVWQLRAPVWQQVQQLKPLVIAAFVVVTLQIALGGWTTSNYAAVACPDLPTCQTQWWPEMDFAQGFNLLQGIGPNYLGGQMDNEARIAIHMAHRIGAIITTLVLMLTFVRLTRLGDPKLYPMAYTLLGVLLLQVALGLGNIIFHFPLYVAVAHNAGGALLLLTMVTLTHRVYSASQLEAKAN